MQGLARINVGREKGSVRSDEHLKKGKLKMVIRLLVMVVVRHFILYVRQDLNLCFLTMFSFKTHC